MNNQTNDFFTLYQGKCRDYEALENELNEMKDLGQLIEKELESEVEILSHEKQKILEKNQELQCKLQELKKNYSSEIGFYERKTDQMEDENMKMKEELKSKNRMITQNEIEIENLESQLRISQMAVSDLEYQLENMFEKITLIQSQLEQTKADNEEEVQRLKDRLQESQNEILAFKRREATLKKFEEMRASKMLTENQNLGNLATDPAKHYGAYQGQGGDDPAPFKKLKVELGKRCFGHINYEENNNNNQKNSGQRAFKSHHLSGRSQRIANMNEQGVEGIGRTQGFELFQQNAEIFGQGFPFGN